LNYEVFVRATRAEKVQLVIGDQTWGLKARYLKELGKFAALIVRAGEKP
jgi:hypothetical protein